MVNKCFFWAYGSTWYPVSVLRKLINPSLFTHSKVWFVGSNELLACVICRRGLSKYYKGKSRTFTSLSHVRCIEDFSKRFLITYYTHQSQTSQRRMKRAVSPIYYKKKELIPWKFKWNSVILHERFQ